MDVMKSMKTRHSTRAFLPKNVSLAMPLIASPLAGEADSR